MKRIPKFLHLMLSASLMAAVPHVYAHHSPSSFDMTNVVTVTGTVKDFKWGNPHIWLYMMVPNENGGVDEWEIEGPPVTMVARHGWKSTTIKPGDKIHVLLGPRRDGKPGGSFMRVTLANGDVFDTGRIELSKPE